VTIIDRDHPELPGRFYSAQAELQKAPWSMATGADFAVPGVIGHRPLSNRIFDPVFRLIMEYSADDPALRMTLGKVRSTCYGHGRICSLQRCLPGRHSALFAG